LIQRCIHWARHKASERIDPASIALARIFFGVCMLVDATLLWPLGDALTPDRFQFKYPLLEWVAPLPYPGTYLEILIWGAAAIGLALGFCTRLSALCLFVSFTHVFLIDSSYYNNHLYLFSMTAFWFSIFESNRCWSVDQLIWPHTSHTAPAWNLFVLRTLLVLVYFFGGVAKINADWISGSVTKVVLSQAAERTPALAGILSSHATNMTVVYGGLFLDLIGPFFLLWRRTRLLTAIIFVLFHLSNGVFLFNDIGTFPWVMIGLTAVFFEPSLPRRLISKLTNSRAVVPTAQPGTPPASNWLVAGLSVYFAIQLVLPLLHYGNKHLVDWSMNHRFFAWHMKSFTKDTYLRMVEHRADGTATDINPRQFLNTNQIANLETSPRALFEFCRYYRDSVQKDGDSDITIHCDYVVSMNLRMPEYCIDPGIDCASDEVAQRHFADWVLPLSDPPVRRSNPFRGQEWRDLVSQAVSQRNRTYTGQALWLLENDRLAEAESEWTRITQREPQNSSGWLKLGDCLRRQGKMDGAVDCYLKSVELNPEVSEAQNNLGALLSRKDPQKAIPHLNRAIELEPDNAQAHSNLGNALARTGKLQEAISHYTKALELKPDFKQCRRNLKIVRDMLASASQNG
jgi:hypothetical protein